MIEITIENLHRWMFRKDFVIFTNDAKPFNLNLVAIRTAENVPNVFNDWLVVFWKYRGEWNILKFPVTTDAGLYWLGTGQIGNEKGTAMVCEGQYLGMWKKGLHRGKYRALVQVAPCKLVRDFNRDGLLNPDAGTVEEVIAGINCHRANATGTTDAVGAYSAGCIVFADASEYALFMSLVELSDSLRGTQAYTFTLLEEKNFSS